MCVCVCVVCVCVVCVCVVCVCVVCVCEGGREEVSEVAAIQSGVHYPLFPSPATACMAHADLLS